MGIMLNIYHCLTPISDIIIKNYYIKYILYFL
jgi:hypothetical protein